jgi:hypothetical protein
MFLVVLDELLQAKTVDPALGEGRDAIAEAHLILQILEALILCLRRADGIFPVELLPVATGKAGECFILGSGACLGSS